MNDGFGGVRISKGTRTLLMRWCGFFHGWIGLVGVGLALAAKRRRGKARLRVRGTGLKTRLCRDGGGPAIQDWPRDGRRCGPASKTICLSLYNEGQDILPEADLDPNESPKPDPAR
jgi:hypothetical protein